MAENNPTIFGSILRGEIPAKRVHEDEHCIAFADIQPQAPVHLLVIPRQHIPSLKEAQPTDSALLGHLLLCLLYTSPSPRDGLLSRMPSSA